jgi:arginyl-tRNA synthetase
MAASTGQSGLRGLLGSRLGRAFADVAGEAVDPVVRRSQRADFQADGALALARRLGRNPRDVATAVLDRADLADLCSAADIAGPGFINLTLADSALGRLLAELAADERLGVPLATGPDTVVIDYSAPNAAKEMHVGHLRSTIIGDAIVRLLEWLGHTVLRQNHIGEWGTPFGMLIEHLLDLGATEAAREMSTGDLNGFYQQARAKFDADEAFRERSRGRVVLLQSGDPATRELWRVLVEGSKAYFMAVYGQLGVRLTEDDFVGESFYNDRLRDVMEELERVGMLRESDGALCVFPEGFTNRDGSPLPLIVQKSDGGFGYGVTDLAAIRYRLQTLGGTRLLYVVGLPQEQHLAMVFQVAREAGWLTPAVRAQHIGFGSILGADGKMLRTRAGASVKLSDLLQEAEARAAALVQERSPNLDEETSAAVARAVGIGAVKYADLSTERVKNYVFDWDRMLAFDGNTAPYLQYAHARICSIFRRAGLEPPRDVPEIIVSEPAERALALELLGFATVCAEVAESLELQALAGYLFNLATVFTSFYERCPVLRSEGPMRASRLALCDLTARTLARGLDLLGIAAPTRM